MSHILVVEDDPLNRDLIARRLEAHGFDFTMAESGKEGVAKASAGEFDAVLLDLRLPDIDGAEVLSIVRRARPTLPVIIMTAHGSTVTRDEVLAAGANAYLLKPVRRQELIDVLEQTIERAR